MSGVPERCWVQEALGLLRRKSDPQTVGSILAAIVKADGPQHRLDAPGMDGDAALHRQTFCRVLADAGLDGPLVEALYAVETNPSHKPFAENVVSTLETLHGAGLRLPRGWQAGCPDRPRADPYDTRSASDGKRDGRLEVERDASRVAVSRSPT